MIHIDPKGPWPRRIRIGFWVMGVLLVLQVVMSFVGKYMVSSKGGEAGYRTWAKMKALEAGMAWRHQMTGKYPTQQEGLDKLVHQKRGISRPSSEPKDMPNIDGWGREFRYLYPGKHNHESYDLWSAGEDGIDDTDDDVTNWR